MPGDELSAGIDAADAESALETIGADRLADPAGDDEASLPHATSIEHAIGPNTANLDARMKPIMA